MRRYERRRAGFNGQGKARSLVSVRAELRLGDANSEYKLQRVTTTNSGELHCESEGGARRESELEQGEGEGEGSASIL
jgi:hypothetical protein